MPIYEYQCDACEAEFELLVRGGDRLECPTCGSHELSQLLSVPAAPVTNGASLPIAGGPRNFGGCGKPQCGMGGCGM